MFFFQPFDDVLNMLWSVIICDIVRDIKTNWNKSAIIMIIVSDSMNFLDTWHDFNEFGILVTYFFHYKIVILLKIFKVADEIF